MLAAKTALPVIGVPIPTQHLGGLDSLLSIVQMPRGVPVATVAIGNATNAGLLASRLASRYDIRISPQTRDLIAVQLNGNPAFMSFLFAAASASIRPSPARRSFAQCRI